MNCRYIPTMLLISRTLAFAGTINVQPMTQTVIPGQSFSVNVNSSAVTDLYGYQFDLGFTPGILSATSITEGSFLPGGGSTFFIPGTIDNVGGTIVFNADSLVGAIPGKTGSGTLATVNFKALANGTSAVNLSNVTLLDSTLSNITAGLANGSVTVQGPVSGVPEPQTYSLMALGSIALLAAHCRRRRDCIRRRGRAALVRA